MRFSALLSLFAATLLFAISAAAAAVLPRRFSLKIFAFRYAAIADIFYDTPIAATLPRRYFAAFFFDFLMLIDVITLAA